MLVDFHAHTRASDGALEPAALAASMCKRGVQIFSITDHDSLDAYDAVGTEIEGARVVVGIEINTTYKGNEVHILGYGLPLGDSVVRRTIDANRAARTDRAEAMIGQLKRAGYDLSMDDVRAQAGPEAALGRPHVAKALVQLGITRSLETAFRDFLTPGKPAYVPSHHIKPQEAIAAIARSGGVPVLAHPGRLHDENLIDEMAEAGIQGLEVFYRTHRPGQVARYRERAAELGLVMTAGSDFHDYAYSPGGVGMEVEEADLRPFLDLVLE